MGKLNIAHHKSYHPYRRDNIERVRRDEEQARQEEAVAEGRMMLADSEARMDLLRQRAGAPSIGRHIEQKAGPDVALEVAGPSSLTSTGGHINLFEDLERSLAVSARSTKRPPPPETDKGFPLAPSENDLKPWYSDRDHERNRGPDGDRRIRDIARKSVHDPLTSINSQLAAQSAPNGSRRDRERARPPPRPAARPELSERLTRESSERQRALELIRRKKREMEGSATPSTVRGGSGMSGGYTDQFNREEVEEAHRFRDRRLDRDRGDRRHGGGDVRARW